MMMINKRRTRATTTGRSPHVITTHVQKASKKVRLSEDGKNGDKEESDQEKEGTDNGSEAVDWVAMATAQRKQNVSETMKSRASIVTQEGNTENIVAEGEQDPLSLILQRTTNTRGNEDTHFMKGHVGMKEKAQTGDTTMLSHTTQTENCGDLSNKTYSLPSAIVTKQNGQHNNESSVGNASALTKSAMDVLEKKAAKLAREERRSVKEFVLTTLFRKVKFLASEDMLDCYVRKMVEDGLGVTNDTGEKAWWWAQYRGVVKHALSEKRSNITSDMRRRFEKGTVKYMHLSFFPC